MKNAVILFLVLFCSFRVTLSAQTTRIVCNAPGYNGGVTNSTVFNNLQAAITASNAGDIIMVQGSGVSYGNITIEKQLWLIGPGYFLG